MVWGFRKIRREAEKRMWRLYNFVWGRRVVIAQMRRLARQECMSCGGTPVSRWDAKGVPFKLEGPFGCRWSVGRPRERQSETAATWGRPQRRTR